MDNILPVVMLGMFLGFLMFIVFIFYFITRIYRSKLIKEFKVTSNNYTTETLEQLLLEKEAKLKIKLEELC